MKEVLKHYMSRVEQSIAQWANEEITESSARAMVAMLETWEKLKCIMEKM